MKLNLTTDSGTLLPYGWSFSRVQIFMKQARIQVSEIFSVSIFIVGESGMCGLVS